MPDMSFIGAFLFDCQSVSVRAEDLFYRHPQSPYLGLTLTGRVVQTILRGRTVAKDGRLVAGQKGQLIKPV